MKKSSAFFLLLTSLMTVSCNAKIDKIAIQENPKTEQIKCDIDPDKKIKEEGGEVQISVFRAYRSYPPNTKEDPSPEHGYHEIFNSTPSIFISENCLEKINFEFNFDDENGKYRPGTRNDIKPINIKKIDGMYYLFLIYRNYPEVDEANRELAMAVAIYDGDGNLIDLIERASAWRSYENTLILKDLCISKEGMVSIDIGINPKTQDRVGNVLKFEKPEVSYFSMEPDGEPIQIPADSPMAKECRHFYQPPFKSPE